MVAACVGRQEVVRERRFEVDEFARERVPEFQHGGVERLTREPQQFHVIRSQRTVLDLQEEAFVRAVELVPGERESERMKRCAHLMLPPGPETRYSARAAC